MKKWVLGVFFLILVGCNQVDEEIGPPPVSVVIGEIEYSTAQGSYSWSVRSLSFTQNVIADSAAPPEIAEGLEPIVVEKGTVLEVVTTGDPGMSLYIWDEDDREEIPMDGNFITAPDEAGWYVYEIYSWWDNGESSNTFVLEVE